MIGLDLFIPKTIYVKIYENRIELKLLGPNPKTVTILPEKPFSSKRLLIGDIFSAAITLRKGMKDVLSGIRTFVRPMLILSPIEKADDFSMVEKISLRDLAEHAGAQSGDLYLGSEMTPEQEVALVWKGNRQKRIKIIK